MFFKDLFKHMYWADAVAWRAIFATPQTEGDARLGELLYHIHLTRSANRHQACQAIPMQ